MRIAIIQFPGSNCERETCLAVKRSGMTPEEFLWNGSPQKLADYDGYIIVGGFSYEDRSRAGILAALDPLMQVIKEQNEKGKPILGICNGAQILVEAGLVPGVENNKLALSLTENKRMRGNEIIGTGYYNNWITMRVSDQYQLNAFTRKLSPKNILRVPVAHAEGRFVIPPALLNEMQENGLNLFQYCDSQGKILDEFPINPNGSVDNIAAISNKAGNVMAMMPHPERTPEGDAIFQSMRDYIAENKPQKTKPLYYYPRPIEIKKYHSDYHQILVDLIITDNVSMSVQNTLDHLKIPVKVNRFTHWEINCDSAEIFEKIKSSGVLFNDRKEKLATSLRPSMTHFLTRPKDDIIGQQKKQMLKNHFGVDGVHAIHHGVVWQMTGDARAINEVIQSHILFNPYAHDCYHY